MTDAPGYYEVERGDWFLGVVAESDGAWTAAPSDGENPLVDERYQSRKQAARALCALRYGGKGHRYTRTLSGDCGTSTLQLRGGGRRGARWGIDPRHAPLDVSAGKFLSEACAASAGAPRMA